MKSIVLLNVKKLITYSKSYKNNPVYPSLKFKNKKIIIFIFIYYLFNTINADRLFTKVYKQVSHNKCTKVK